MRDIVSHVRRTLEPTKTALIPLLPLEVRHAAHVFVTLPKDSRLHPLKQTSVVYVAQEWFTKTGIVNARQQTHISLIKMLQMAWLAQKTLTHLLEAQKLTIAFALKEQQNQTQLQLNSHVSASWVNTSTTKTSVHRAKSVLFVSGGMDAKATQMGSVRLAPRVRLKKNA